MPDLKDLLAGKTAREHLAKRIGWRRLWAEIRLGKPHMPSVSSAVAKEEKLQLMIVKALGNNPEKVVKHGNLWECLLTTEREIWLYRSKIATAAAGIISLGSALFVISANVTNQPEPDDYMSFFIVTLASLAWIKSRFDLRHAWYGVLINHLKRAIRDNEKLLSGDSSSHA